MISLCIGMPANEESGDFGGIRTDVTVIYSVKMPCNRSCLQAGPVGQLWYSLWCQNSGVLSKYCLNA